MERGKKLSKAPVVYSLVHVKFSPVLTLATHIPAIQEELRKTYPRYAVSQFQQVRLGTDGKPELGNTEQQWDFTTKDNDAGIRLGTGSFIYQCTRYSTFQDFLKDAISGLRIVHGYARIALVERIGVRYVDLVIPDENKSVTDYLVPSLTGFRAVDEGENKFEFCINQTNLKTKLGTLVVRCVVGEHTTPLPPDLAACNLAVLKQPPNDRVTALVDTDHYSEVPLDFDIDEVNKRIDALHQPISKTFWNSITEFAGKAWA